jgi:RsiW-degrading membrane proteinase PrsW (M82 family)
MNTEMLKTICILANVCFFLVMYIPSMFCCLYEYQKGDTEDSICILIGSFFVGILLSGMSLLLSLTALGLGNC